MTRGEVKVAPNIYKTPYGWRVYIRATDPVTGTSIKKPVRFGPEVTLPELEHFRDSYKLERKRLQRGAVATPARGPDGFAGDAARYLTLKTVQAMPTFKTRTVDIERWAAIFRNRSRASITTGEIDEQLQAWRDEGYAASTVNHRRTALMSLYTKLDGRAAPNPVREAKEFESPELEPRGLPYDLVERILNAVPAVRAWSHLNPKKTRPIKTRIRLEVMAFTGMRPCQIGRLRPQHFSIAERWFVTPRTRKGQRSARHPRPNVRKPLTASAAAALQRFVDIGCWGKFSTSSAQKMFTRAVREVEATLQQERNDPAFRLPHLVPYDLRHSFGTRIFEKTGNLTLVQELLDHSTPELSKRYALGALPRLLQGAVAAFESDTVTDRTTWDLTPRRPAAPKPRRASGASPEEKDEEPPERPRRVVHARTRQARRAANA